MFNLKRVTVLLVFIMGFASATAVSAQTPRPTPTNVGGGAPSGSDSDKTGSMQGHVYQDVNGDGICGDSGIEGEGFVVGVPVEFVSSDEATIITVTSGDDGGFGLFAAGQSYWRVTAKPDSGWVVTSENPRYVPVYPETLGHTGVDFCVAQGSATANGVIVLDGSQIADGSVLLPEAGAAASELHSANNYGWVVWITAVFGLLLFAWGIILHRRQTT